jgi:hypothetical protein
MLLCLAMLAPQPVEVRARTAALNGNVLIDVAGDRARARRVRVTLTRVSDGVAVTAWTGHDGDFQFQHLAEGRHTIDVEKAGLVARRVSLIVSSGNATLEPIVMQRGGALEGRMVNYLGKPISGLVINAEPVRDADGRADGAPRAASTDDLGRFRIHSLAPGRYRVYAPGTGLFHPGTERQEEATVLTVSPGQTIGDLNLAAPPPETSYASAGRAPTAVDRPSPRTASSGEVSGRVMQSDARLPLADVTVQVQGVLSEIDRNKLPGEFARAINTLVNTTAKTDDLGRFAFGGLPAGEYTVTIRASGFASADGAGGLSVVRRVALRDGQRVSLPDVRLAPFGAIEGRLLDEFGEPAPGIVLQVLQPSYMAGAMRLAAPTAGVSIATAPTDDRGAFRLAGLPPGEYRLAALSKPFESKAPGGFVTTYFPGSRSVEASRAVLVEPGPTVTQVEFGIVPAQSASVAGIAIDVQGRPAVRARVKLLPREGDDIPSMLVSEATTDSEGRFEYLDVPEGVYIVQATAASTFGSASLIVPGSTGGAALPLTVTLKPMVTARGRVVFEGGQAKPDFWYVTLQPTDGVGGPLGPNVIPTPAAPMPSAATLKDTRFTIVNLAHRGVIRVTTPPGWALVRVTLHGRDITDRPWDFQSEDVNGLEVVLTDRVGSVSGSVLHAGQPMPYAGVMIVGAESESLLYGLRTLRSAQADSSGVFSVTGLLPGRYLAVAVPDGTIVRDPARLLKLRSLGAPVIVTERADAKVVLAVK